MKLLGHGAIGCVINDFKYSCNKKFSFPTVEKIVYLNKKFIKNEIEVSKIILNINNWKKYFAPMVYICELNIEHNLLNNNNINNNIKNKLKKIEHQGDKKYLIQIIPKLDGKSLFEYKYFNMNSQELFLFIRHLIIGLNNLHKNNIIHFDIKQENIIWNLKKNNFKNFNLCYIDFGLSFLINRANKEDMIKLKYGTKCAFSPEVSLINNENVYFNKNYFSEKEFNVMMSYKNIGAISSLLSLNSDKKILKKMTFLKDVYALGFCLTECIDKLKNKPDYNIIYEIIRDMISFNFLDNNIPKRLTTDELIKKYFS